MLGHWGVVVVGVDKPTCCLVGEDGVGNEPLTPVSPEVAFHNHKMTKVCLINKYHKIAP